MISSWLSDNFIEVFGAVSGILYVFLEIRQTALLWPVGIITSGVYIWVFFTSKLYADMSLQWYYLVISFLGWYWWTRKRVPNDSGMKMGDPGRDDDTALKVTRLDLKTGAILGVVFIILFSLLKILLENLTDSPVPGWDSFITSLSIIATWMLARKIYEHWFLWIVVNSAASVLFLTRGLYPTVVLYIVYGVMSFAGLWSWKKAIVNG